MDKAASGLFLQSRKMGEASEALWTPCRGSNQVCAFSIGRHCCCSPVIVPRNANETDEADESDDLEDDQEAMDVEDVLQGELDTRSKGICSIPYRNRNF